MAKAQSADSMSDAVNVMDTLFALPIDWSKMFEICGMSFTSVTVRLKLSGHSGISKKDIITDSA